MIFYGLTNSGNHMGVALNWCVCLKADVTFTTHHDTSTWGCHQAKHGQTWPNIFSRHYHSLIFTNIFTIFKSLFVPPDLSLTGNPIPSSRHSVHGASGRHNVPELAQIVRRYCVRMAVRRGVMAEARRRLRLREEMAEAAMAVARWMETKSLEKNWKYNEN